MKKPTLADRLADLAFVALFVALAACSFFFLAALAAEEAEQWTARHLPTRRESPPAQ